VKRNDLFIGLNVHFFSFSQRVQAQGRFNKDEAREAKANCFAFVGQEPERSDQSEAA
jgi:hypothetical protein